MAEMVEVVELISFLPDGSSKHVWTFPDGSTREETFTVSPILFRRAGSKGIAFDTARERGIAAIARRVSLPALYDTPPASGRG
jgi:hypothetical protein